MNPWNYKLIISFAKGLYRNRRLTVENIGDKSLKTNDGDTAYSLGNKILFE